MTYIYSEGYLQYIVDLRRSRVRIGETYFVDSCFKVQQQFALWTCLMFNNAVCMSIFLYRSGYTHLLGLSSKAYWKMYSFIEHTFIKCSIVCLWMVFHSSCWCFSVFFSMVFHLSSWCFMMCFSMFLIWVVDVSWCLFKWFSPKLLVYMVCIHK